MGARLGGGGVSAESYQSYIDHDFDEPEEVGEFTYKLSRTDSNSATLDFAIGFVSPLAFDLFLGDISISFQHEGYEIAHVYASDMNLRAGAFALFAPSLWLHGQEELDSRCWDRVDLENRAFCVCNDALASIAAGVAEEGTEITILVSGTNHYGEDMSIQMKTQMLPIDPDHGKSATTPRSDDTPAQPPTSALVSSVFPASVLDPGMPGEGEDEEEAASAATDRKAPFTIAANEVEEEEEEEKEPKLIDQIIEKTDLKVSENIKNLFMSVWYSDLEIDFAVTFGNPFLIGLQIDRIELSVAIRDSDGIQDIWYIPDTPQQPAEFAPLFDDFIYRFDPPLEVRPNSTGLEYDFEITLPWDTLTAAIARLYDEYVVKKRLCLHITNFELVLQLQAPGYQPLMFHQVLSRNFVAISGGPTACEGGVECVPLLHTAAASPVESSMYDFNSGAKYYGGGIRLTELCYTCTSDSRASAFYREAVDLQDSWMVMFDVEFDELISALDPSEGFAFIIAGTTHEVGRDFGYSGIDNSFGWIFDTDRHFGQLYQNGKTTDWKVESDDIPGIGDFQPRKYRIKIYYHHHVKRTYVYIDGVFLMLAEMDTNDLWLDGGKGYKIGRAHV